MIQHTRELLGILLPICVVSFAISFVKSVFIKQEGSIFKKALIFFASTVFGITCAYITINFTTHKGIVLLIDGTVTFLADQISNKIDKVGLSGIISVLREYIKARINKTPSNTTPNDNQPGNG